MTSISFETARQRILSRREQARLQSPPPSDPPSLLRLTSRLPSPLSSLAHTTVRTWSSISGREGTHPSFRVSQLDAELLDEELLSLFQGQVGEGLKYFFGGAHLREEWKAEILLALRAVLWKLSVWDHDASYGAMLQNLRYTDARREDGYMPRKPSGVQKGVYGLVSVGGRYAWEKWEGWLAEREGRYEGPAVQVRILSRLSSLAVTAHSIAAFSSFLVFFVNGRYRTLLDRILRLRLSPPSGHLRRQVSFEYLNRQLVWHAFTEFLLFLLPLVGITRWRRWLTRAWRKLKALIKSSDEEEDAEPKGELAYLPERTCAICHQDKNPTSASENEILAMSGGGVIGSAQTDITNPYEMVPCGCTYCFVCAASRLEAADGEGWVCLRCGALVKECKPWAGDVVEGPSTLRNKKSVSFTVAEREMSEKG
ncbi:MAG: hypothetical protein Q9219_005424 [cf. Caloplaca sp. 3 TL-2023]